MPNITNTTADVFLAEVFSKEVIRETNPKLVLAKLVKRFDDEAREGNDSISVPSLTNFVANDKVSNIPVSFQANTETDVIISIDQHKETSFLLEDITELQSKQDLMAHYTDAASTAIARAIDTSLAALALGFSTATGVYNTAITTDVVLNSIEFLDLADCPEDDRAFVFRSDVKRDLLDLNAYISSDFVGGRPLESGTIGKLYGVDTYMSNNLIFTGGTNRNNMLFHKDALALAMAQQPRAQAEYSVAQLGHELVVDTVYGVREMRDDFGVLVRT